MADTKQIMTRVPADVHAWIERLADQLGVSKSGVVALIVGDARRKCWLPETPAQRPPGKTA